MTKLARTVWVLLLTLAMAPITIASADYFAIDVYAQIGSMDPLGKQSVIIRSTGIYSGTTSIGRNLSHANKVWAAYESNPDQTHQGNESLGTISGSGYVTRCQGGCSAAEVQTACMGRFPNTYHGQANIIVYRYGWTNPTWFSHQDQWDSTVACGWDDDPPDGNDTSPIIVDLDGGGLQLSGLAPDPVIFDIDADGSNELVSWTLWDSGDAFLALDRNGNGRVDDGRELFGNYTLLADGSEAEHGFIALAEFDLPAHGGNQDGWLDSADAAFSDLLFWLDSNRNGYSESSELAPATALGLRSIELNWVETRRRDQHGNEFRFKGRARIEVDGHVRTRALWDVFLLTRDP